MFVRTLILSCSFLVCQLALAENIQSFVAHHYFHTQTESLPSIETQLPLQPEIKLAEHTIVMEKTTLKQLHSLTGATIRQGEHADWLCVSDSKQRHVWFISDSEMGHGDLTSVAVTDNAKDGAVDHCQPFAGEVSIAVGNLPLLHARKAEVQQSVGQLPNPSEPIFTLLHYTMLDEIFYQGNSLTYFIEDGQVSGMLMEQITSN